MMAPQTLQSLHVFTAILAAWRITELFTQDRITDRLRKRFPTYLWQCPRCMSVWAGVYATAALCLLPWLNWPFALAWLYLAHNDAVTSKRIAKRGRRFLIELKANGTFTTHSELSEHEIRSVLSEMPK